MTTNIEQDFEYDVCFSFAGENRTYVDQVAAELKNLVFASSMIFTNRQTCGEKICMFTSTKFIGIRLDTA